MLNNKRLQIIIYIARQLSNNYLKIKINIVLREEVYLRRRKVELGGKLFYITAPKSKQLKPILHFRVDTYF